MNSDKQTIFEEDPKHTTNAGEVTSTGLSRNVAGLLCYVLGFVTGIIFLIVEKENRFIRFHAYQSIFAFAALFILNLILTSIPFIGWIVGILMAPLGIILWIVLMNKAYQGRYFKLPLVGDLAEKQAIKTNG